MGLTVSRRNGESVIIGDDIEVIVHFSDHSGKIRLTINAPPDVRVFRKEIWPGRSLTQEQDAKDSKAGITIEEDHRRPDADFQVGG